MILCSIIVLIIKKTQISNKPFIKWLIGLYDIDSICGPIKIFFANKQLSYVKYSIRFFDISELKIDPYNQQLFDVMINEYQNSQCHVKSARK